MDSFIHSSMVHDITYVAKTVIGRSYLCYLGWFIESLLTYHNNRQLADKHLKYSGLWTGLQIEKSAV